MSICSIARINQNNLINSQMLFRPQPRVTPTFQKPNFTKQNQQRDFASSNHECKTFAPNNFHFNLRP